MYLAVKFADANNHKKLPVGYPCQCRELQDDVPCPEGYQKMTVAELEELKNTMRPEYEQYLQQVYHPHIERVLDEHEKIDEIQLEMNKINGMREKNRDHNRLNVLKKSYDEISERLTKINAFEEV